jgi:glycosyltransferase involved in cell wall biosynthesis
MGYRRPAEKSVGEEDAAQFWRTAGVFNEEPQFIACFFGAISRHYEIDTVLQAARRLEQSGRRIKFVLCGDGPELSRWRRKAADCPNVVLPGWVDAVKIRCLSQQSSVGLAPYYSSWDFAMSLPNKPIEYLSAGLPVISSLQGELAELLAKNDCGLTYRNGSADDLVRVLADCYDHPAKLAKMAHNAGQLYRKRFVAEVVYGEMADFLTEVATTNRRAAAA